MNKTSVNRLHKDLEKYSKQIGISELDIPELVTDKYQLRNAIMERTGDPSYSNDIYYKYKSKAGSHFHGLKLVYVNCHQPYQKETKKPLAYTHFLGALIHELVHYRFDELEHGREFDQRINEIIRGKTFPKWSAQNHQRITV
jgi:hypothetical protein